MKQRTALLGWGSLLWDGDKAFDIWHEPWQRAGPTLRIEFSRISRSRSGALTLVIDPEKGSPVRVFWSISRRPTIDQAVEDLRKREGTDTDQIGTFSLAGQARGFDRNSLAAIQAWAVEHGLDGVIWTDLRSNFAERTGEPFSVDAAVRYLKALQGDVRAKAFEYIQNAPALVQTPLRAAFADGLEEESPAGGKD